MNPLAVALQGVGFGPLAMVSQGVLYVPSLPPVSGVVEGSGFKSARDWSQDVSDLALIHSEDQTATELLVTLVTQGFFHGNL